MLKQGHQQPFMVINVKRSSATAPFIFAIIFSTIFILFFNLLFNFCYFIFALFDFYDLLFFDHLFSYNFYLNPRLEERFPHLDLWKCCYNCGFYYLPLFKSQLIT